MTTKVHLDFETQSEATDVDAWLYAEHKTTSPMCLAFKVDNDPTKLIPAEDHALDSPYGHELYSMAEDESVLFVAHNAMFEMAIWENHYVKPYDFPPIALNRWRCTMAKSYAHGLPGGLDAVSQSLQLPIKKDMEGNAIMKRLSKPRHYECAKCPTKKNGKPYTTRQCPFCRPVFWEPEDDHKAFKKLYEYCQQDVVVEKLVDDALRDLTRKEQRVWQIDMRMNRDGIYFDVPLLEKAQKLIDVQRAKDVEEFSRATGDPELTSPTQRVKLKSWLAAQGFNVKDTTEPTLKKFLKQDLPEYVRIATEIASENKTSLSKYGSALARTTPLGQYRGAFVYHGAHTGRWSGRGVQVQNLKRPEVSIPVVVAAIEKFYNKYGIFAYLYPEVSNAIASAIRGMVIPPPGHRLFVADFAQMEARVLAWLAGQLDVLELFANGEDLYCDAASQIYGRTITKADKIERFTGKVAVLALGYQGGIGAFSKMAENYGVNLLEIYRRLWGTTTADERDKADFCYRMYRKTAKDPVTREEAFIADIIKQRWRRGNDKIESYWHATEAAAITAVQTGEVVSCGKVQWFTHTLSDVVYLSCKLPSGRVMHYPRPRVSVGSRGKLTLSYESAEKGRIHVYGGKLVENVTQAVQRDLTAEALIRLEDLYPACAHIHDEIVSYVRDGYGDLDEFMEIMRAAPQWADGIPIDVDGWQGYRYGKAA